MHPSLIDIYRRMIAAYRANKGVRLSPDELDALMLSDDIGWLILRTVKQSDEDDTLNPPPK